ncbi:hypothetical protein JZ906_10085, partial [Riemerella anatipestifer]|uniref:hypothetical protein n=2 Tax=Riemerella anatipestifer TaxID=34085 RepID=UPI0030BF6065
MRSSIPFLFNSSEFCEKQNKKVRNDKIVIILFILYGFFYDIAHNGGALRRSGLKKHLPSPNNTKVIKITLCPNKTTPAFLQ